VNGWDVRPTLELAGAKAITCSSGRIVRDRLTTAPGPDPALPAAQLRASTVRAGHPVVVSTAACGGRLGGGPAHDGVLYLPRPRPRTDRGDAITPYHVTPTYSTRKRRAPSGVALRAHLPEPDSVEASGAHFPIKTGAQFPIGITIATKQKIQNQLSRGTSSHDVNGGINRVFRAVEDGEAEAGQTWLLGKSTPP
jgi:hypothetical protein